MAKTENQENESATLEEINQAEIEQLAKKVNIAHSRLTEAEELNEINVVDYQTQLALSKQNKLYITIIEPHYYHRPFYEIINDSIRKGSETVGILQIANKKNYARYKSEMNNDQKLWYVKLFPLGEESSAEEIIEAVNDKLVSNKLEDIAGFHFNITTIGQKVMKPVIKSLAEQGFQVEVYNGNDFISAHMMNGKINLFADVYRINNW